MRALRLPIFALLVLLAACRGPQQAYTSLGPHAFPLRLDLDQARSWLGAVNDTPTVYICRNFTCQPPITTIEALDRELAAIH